MKGKRSPIRRRLDAIVGRDRRGGTRGAEFEPGGPVVGTPTGKSTEVNIKIVKRPIPPGKAGV